MWEAQVWVRVSADQTNRACSRRCRYLKKVPDVALFACIANAESGGDSLWADGFALAERLRRTCRSWTA